MTLAKLTVEYERGLTGFTGIIKALFNPNELTFSRSLEWKPRVPAASPTAIGLDFHERGPETLSLQLFLDTYETSSADGTLRRSLVDYLSELEALASIDQELHRPPLCRLRWGKQDVFQGALTSVTRKHVLFLEDGTPVRATLECSFIELSESGDADSELHSPDVARQYTIMRGDTLRLIASRFYGDPSLWRAIATANDIDDPRRLQPGRSIIIPKVS